MTENLPKAMASYFDSENQSSQKAFSAKRLDKYPFHLIFFYLPLLTMGYCYALECLQKNLKTLIIGHRQTAF